MHPSYYSFGWTKEVVIKEQSTPRNLSATATRVLQCTCPVAASWKDCSAIGKFYIVDMIRYMYKTDWRAWAVTQNEERPRSSLRWDLLFVPCTSFNLFGIKITILHKFRPLGAVKVWRSIADEALQRQHFCRRVKGEKLIPGIVKVPSMESTMVGAKEM